MVPSPADPGARYGFVPPAPSGSEKLLFDAVADEIATWEGDGSFLHGLAELPSWIKLGADLRYAYVQHDPGGPDAPTTALFPMQLDAHARLKFGDFSFATA